MRRFPAEGAKLYFASDLSTYVTGTVHLIDGA
jgi:hypothetical protein